MGSTERVHNEDGKINEISLIEKTQDGPDHKFIQEKNWVPGEYKYFYSSYTNNCIVDYRHAHTHITFKPIPSCPL